MVQVVDDGKEEKKLAMARAILAGNTSFINDNADVFEGLSPTEIEEYVAKATEGATSSDPFEARFSVQFCVSWCRLCWISGASHVYSTTSTAYCMALTHPPRAYEAAVRVCVCRA